MCRSINDTYVLSEQRQTYNLKLVKTTTMRLSVKDIERESEQIFFYNLYAMNPEITYIYNLYSLASSDILITSINFVNKSIVS